MATSDFLTGAGLARVYSWELQEYLQSEDTIDLDTYMPESFAILAAHSSTVSVPIYYAFNTGVSSANLSTNCRQLIVSPGFHLTSSAPYPVLYYKSSDTSTITKYQIRMYNSAAQNGYITYNNGINVSSLYGVSASTFYVVWSSTYNMWFVNTSTYV